MTDLRTLPDRYVLALTIWGEARGQAVDGQIAVANVVRNRWRDSPTAFWRDICLKPKQFSCFNLDDPNRQKVEKAATMLLTQALTPELKQALWIADGVMSGSVLDNTEGATHYLTTELLQRKPPAWAKAQPVLVTIGAHSFLQVA